MGTSARLCQEAVDAAHEYFQQRDSRGPSSAPSSSSATATAAHRAPPTIRTLALTGNGKILSRVDQCLQQIMAEWPLELEPEPGSRDNETIVNQTVLDDSTSTTSVTGSGVVPIYRDDDDVHPLKQVGGLDTADEWMAGWTGMDGFAHGFMGSRRTLCGWSRTARARRSA